MMPDGVGSRESEGGGERRRRRYGSEAVAAAADPTTWEIWPAPEGHREVLYQRFPEFTCLCPRSEYPDFATVHLVTIPDRKVLELKHLKLWLNSFRDRADLARAGDGRDRRNPGPDARAARTPSS